MVFTSFKGFVEKGTTIFQTKPFVYVLSSKNISDRCDNCLASGKLLKCSGCKYVYYCNRLCQKESWPIHKVECPNMKRVLPKIIPDAARLMAQIIIKLNQGGGNELEYYTKTSFRQFKDLMSHYPNIKKDTKRMEHFVSLCGVLHEFLNEFPIPNSADLMGIYGRICVNSFNILDEDMNNIGVGIYLGPSIIDHSCKPNAVAVFEGTTIIIRTLQDIPNFDWSSIRISYIDVLNSTKDRQTELLKSYYFKCNCEKCEETEDFVSAAMCPNESCRSSCLIDINGCNKCGTELSSKFKEEFKEVMEFTQHHLQNMKNIAFLDVSKICLKKQENILHPFNILHIRTIEAAFDAAVNLGSWIEAENYAKKLIPGYELYYGEIHPLTGLLYLTYGKIQLLMEKPKESYDTLQIAKKILTITHGEEHSIVKYALKKIIHETSM